MDSIKNELIENLLEAEAKSKTDDLYKSIGGTGYVLAKDYDKWEKNKDAYTGDKFTKGKDGQYTKQDGDDATKSKTGQKVGGPEDFAHDASVNNNKKPSGTSPQQQEEQLSKKDSEKVKSQILITKADAKKQQKVV